MAPAFKIVPLSEGDHTAIAEVMLASRAEALPNIYRPRSDDEIRAWVRDTMLQKGQTWVAKSDEHVVGFLLLHGEDVNALYLQPGFYRQGIGTQLLAKAKEVSPKRLRLYTFQINSRARAFYEHHGFRALKFADGALNEEKEPDILYEWLGPDQG